MAEGAPDRRAGVEEETFLLVAGRAPRPEEFNALVEGFAAGDARLEPVPTCAGPLLEATLECTAGPVAVKHDYGTHVLEVAFPPCASAAQFEALHGLVWGRLAAAAGPAGITFGDAGHLTALPDGFVFAETDVFAPRTRRLVARPLPPAPLAAPHFLAQMAATQVTLDVDPAFYFAHLPTAYSLLYLVPLLCPSAGTRPVRPLVYRDNLPGHPLAGVPLRIPVDLDDYRRTEAAIPGRFRDYSFLALRRPGLVEVRVADRRPSARATTELIALLLGLFAYSAHAAPDPDPARTLYDYCEFGTLPDRLQDDLAGIQTALDDLPDEWRPATRLRQEAK